MANRLADLRGGGGGGGGGFSTLPPPGGHTAVNMSGFAGAANPENEAAAPEDTDAILNSFCAQVAQVETNLREIQSKTTEVQIKHAEQLRSPDIEASKQVFQELQGIMDEITDMAKSTKVQLDTMSEGTKKLGASEQDAQANSAVIRIQQNQHTRLVRDFAAAMKAYQEVQDENKRAYEDQTARQIKIKCTNKDGTTIDDEEAQQMAREALQMGREDQIFSQSKETLAEIMERRNDILVIEQSMRELNQLFQDLAFLVNEQGEVLDIILHNVTTARTYVQKGNQELTKAKKYGKKSRKKMCWLIICVGMIFAFVLASILGATI